MKVVSSIRWLVVALPLLPVLAPGQAKIQWQGYTWNVRQAVNEGPGPNRWSRSNVWIDKQGDLHMKIDKVDGQWCCPEIWTEKPLGFGTYQCHVEGRLDQLAPNVVFSMFSYAGPDGVNEIDIEFAKWGHAKEKNLWWTVYPSDASKKQTSHGIDIKLDGSYTTSRYKWTSAGVDYRFLGGHQATDSDTNTIGDWNFAPPDSAALVPQKKLPLHFNLWLFEGKPPVDGKPIEFVVHDFTFKAAE
jgi:hypothetical protein